MPVRARIGVFDDVVEAVAGQDVRVILRAMDVVGQRARYHRPDPPHTVVLQHLLERIDECVTGLGEYALVIADEVDAQARHRADLSSYREAGTAGYRSRKLTRIVDTLHFAPSSASRLVQAADVIAFLYRRVFTVQETDERSRKAKIAMWSRLVPRIHHELCWFPAGIGGQQALWGRDVRQTAQRARAGRALRLCRGSGDRPATSSIAAGVTILNHPFGYAFEPSRGPVPRPQWRAAAGPGAPRPADDLARCVMDVQLCAPPPRQLGLKKLTAIFNLNCWPNGVCCASSNSLVFPPS